MYFENIYVHILKEVTQNRLYLLKATLRTYFFVLFFDTLNTFFDIKNAYLTHSLAKFTVLYYK